MLNWYEELVANEVPNPTLLVSELKPRQDMVAS